MHLRHSPVSRLQLPTALGSMLSLHLQARQARTGPFWPSGSPKNPSSQSSQRFPAQEVIHGQRFTAPVHFCSAQMHCGYLWFQRDSWCTPPPWCSGRRHRWHRAGRDTAGSRWTSPGWRRHRNRPYSAHSSTRPCDADSRTLLEENRKPVRKPVKESSNQLEKMLEEKPVIPSVTSIRVTSVAVAVAVARLTGAEGSELWPGTAVSQSALLTVLALVTLRTRALLHPAGRVARATSGRHQGDVVQVTGTCRQSWLINGNKTASGSTACRVTACSYSSRCRCRGS